MEKMFWKKQQLHSWVECYSKGRACEKLKQKNNSEVFDEC